jgi:hypothetical protein
MTIMNGLGLNLFQNYYELLGMICIMILFI